MNKTNDNNLQYFIIIAKKNRKNKFLSLLSEHGAHVLETVYAHGSVGKNVIASAFGFECSQCKVVISCLLKHDKAKEVIDILYKKYKFNKSNTGIAFSILVEGLSF
jgi:hypothetical protein